MTLTLVGNAEKILRSKLRYCPELAWQEGDDDDNADDDNADDECSGDYVSVNDFGAGHEADDDDDGGDQLRYC